MCAALRKRGSRHKKDTKDEILWLRILTNEGYAWFTLIIPLLDPSPTATPPPSPHPNQEGEENDSGENIKEKLAFQRVSFLSAEGGTWTHMREPSLRPERSASANSATSAFYAHWILSQRCVLSTWYESGMGERISWSLETLDFQDCNGNRIREVEQKLNHHVMDMFCKTETVLSTNDSVLLGDTTWPMKLR